MIPEERQNIFKMCSKFKAKVRNACIAGFGIGKELRIGVYSQAEKKSALRQTF